MDTPELLGAYPLDLHLGINPGLHPAPQGGPLDPSLLEEVPTVPLVPFRYSNLNSPDFASPLKNFCIRPLLK